MQCQRCQADQFVKAGFDRFHRQIHRCSRWSRRQIDRSSSAFPGYRFPDEIMALAVRWSLRFRLPSADLADLVAERGIHLDPSTIDDWVHHVAPLSRAAARPHRHGVGGAWSSDEPSRRITGRWCSAFRAFDEDGQVIDVSVSLTRDTEAAKGFLMRAVESTEVVPHVVTPDKAPSSPPAFTLVLPEVDHRTGKMEQQGIERDHHHLTSRTRCMRVLQTISCAQVVCEGHRSIRNLDHGFSRLGLPGGDPGGHRAPRLVRAWDELTVTVAAA
jgi:transposase-like protein